MCYACFEATGGPLTSTFFLLAPPPAHSYSGGMKRPLEDLIYEAPCIVELGDLVALTAQGGLNKPCGMADGMSGTIGNCSGGGIGS
jgi:hypothetical protein